MLRLSIYGVKKYALKRRSANPSENDGAVNKALLKFS